MNLTRRIFSALIPAAPVAGVVARSGLGSSNFITPPTSTSMDVMKSASAGQALLRSATKLVAPPTYQKYLEAQEALQQVRHYRHMLRDYRRSEYQMDADIMALKSVSPQHKIHMQIKRNDDERKQEQSFMKALAESLGLTEFLEKRNTLDNVASAPEKAAANW